MTVGSPDLFTAITTDLGTVTLKILSVPPVDPQEIETFQIALTRSALGISDLVLTFEETARDAWLFV